MRIIAATNRDLAAAAREKTFRPDLYYRINVLPQRLPALRERPDDVAPLALHFLDELSREFHRTPPRLTPEALACLEAYQWPGNARELKNVVERLLLLEGGSEIVTEQLPLEVRLGGAGGPGGGGAAYAGEPGGNGAGFVLPAGGVDLEEVECTLIAQALEAARGNKTRAARLLRLTRDTLRYRLEKFGLEAE